MRKDNIYKSTSIILIVLSIFSYFFGFYLDESSTAAGSIDGDFKLIWNNMLIFLNNDLTSSINHPDYLDSRAPTAYIFHKIFNPFAGTEIGFRKSVFFISTLLPVLFYVCLKKKFKDTDNLLLILLSSTILLSPYFRTSAYWGLGENYSIIFLLLTFLSLSNLQNVNTKYKFKEYIKISNIIFLSCLCFYFDQKLIIIPLICFLKIIFSQQLLKIKIFSTFLYFIMALPYVYLIIVWGSLIPTHAAIARKVGTELFFDQIGYASTIIAFYILPLLLFKKDNFVTSIKNISIKRENYLPIVFFVFYFIYLFFFFNFDEQFLGKGVIHKISYILFDNYYYRLVFTFISFFISALIILFYTYKKPQDFYIISYFFILSIFLYPIFQEYFDPLILILAFTFFNTKINLTYGRSITLYFYLLIFLLCTNVYYLNLFNF